MHFIIRWLLATLCMAGASTAFAQGAATHCQEFGNHRFCTSKSDLPDAVFRDCWARRVTEIERDPTTAKPDWLWPATDSLACMAARGVTASPTPTPVGKAGCSYFGDAGRGKMVKWCKPGANGDESFRLAWNYCMSVGLAFYEHHVLPSTGNGDPDAIVGYVPCMRLQNWTGEIVDMSKERPRGADQHVGAKGTI
jgi:hypothetical protein